ncbi:CREB-regulated transcription coactivator 1 isoform X2 [Centruroides vittatus]|uniref:CREB-regulated transcription coactivator 1 isoform X2 n=1 Tax=Centruroides vittatus TaxID=120091 RepID=UPI00350EFAB3
MANPRKFSEKIALHNQKQAEETAAFEQIMREVIGATRGAYQKHHLHINPSLGSYRGGSLPNVNQIGNNSIDLQSALNSLEDMKQGRETLTERVPRERGRHATPHRNRQFPFEKRADVSPYSSTSFLSPPPDSSWRRTNSDSALHQSATNPQENFHSANSPLSQRRIIVNDVDGSLALDSGQIKNYWDPKKQQTVLLPQSRPKSCEVPGINVFPSQEENALMMHHVPMSNNTGSLPDLTNLHFPPPLTTPLDVEDQTATCTSYNQQTLLHPNTSTLSPPSLTPQRHHTHGLGPSVSGGTLIQTCGGGGSRHSSPGPSPSPSSRRRHHHNLTNIVIGGCSPRHHSHHETRSLQQQQQQQVCNLPYGHEAPRITVEGLTVDTNALSLDSYVSHQQSFGVYPQQSPNTHQNFVYETAAPTSPTLPQISTGSYRSTSPADHSCSAPTSPVSHSFSPASSPGLGPTSSLSKSPFTDTNYYQHQQQQTSALQHQLEQFKMIPESNLVCSSTNSNTVHTNAAMYMPSMDSCDCGPSVEGDILMGRSLGLHYSDNISHGINSSQDGLGNSVMYYNIPNLSSEAPLQSPTLYSKTVISQHTAPQTPQTPTSIPDIILTDHLQALNPSLSFAVQHDTNEIPFLDDLSLHSAPGADDPMMRQDFAKDLGSAMVSMSGSFDSELFTPDDALRAGLDPIDFDGLQILTDPDIPVISDPATEETFRLDRS